jgi:heptosyltransferase-2
LRHFAGPRITVFRAGGLGDTILLVPALRVLARELPAAEITLVGSRWAHRLRPLLPLPVEVVSFDSSELTFLFRPGVDEDSSGLLAGADAVVVYTSAARDVLLANARALSAGDVIGWPAHPGRDAHIAVHLARALLDGPVGLAELPLPGLAPPRRLRLWAREWLRTRFAAAVRPGAVHPGSGGRLKCWPAENFTRVIGGWDGPILLLEGPADRESCRGVLEGMPGAARPPVARGLGVAQVAALLAECRWCLGNDSGLSHLAAGLGVPTVAVFGPTDPAVWSPQGGAVRVVAPSPGAGWPAPQRVLCALAGLQAADA